MSDSLLLRNYLNAIRFAISNKKAFAFIVSKKGVAEMNSSSPLFFSQQERSISLPDSRLVIDPFAFEALDSSVSQADYADQPSLPIHLGYCCPYVQDDTGLEWRNASVVYSRIAEGGNAPTLLW